MSDISHKQDWETPDELFEAINSVYKFTTDVAADHKNAKVGHYYTQIENGLEKKWTGVCWCNPPYNDIGPWVRKASLESFNGTITVMLLPVDTSTKWFHDWVLNEAPIYFLRGRIKFKNAPGPARFASMICIYDRSPASGESFVALTKSLYKPSKNT